MWLTSRLYYYTEEKTDLLLHCVRPMFQELRHTELVDRAYFIRHWHRGPHVRLTLRTQQETLTQVKALIDAHAAVYFRAHPSTRVLREEEIRSRHERLAQQEKVLEPLFPLFPDNSVQHEVEQPDYQIYGGEPGFELAREFYSQSSDLIFRLIERADGDRAVLLSQMFSWMLITAAWLSNMRFSSISYRSHAEGFLHGFDSTGQIRKHFAEQYQRQAEGMHRQYQLFLDTPSYVPPGDLNRDWRCLLDTIGARVEEGVVVGSIRLPSPAHDIERMSAFHQASYRQPWLQEFMYSDHFQTRRLLLNMLYEVMLQAGIRPIEKMFLCYSVSRTAEEVTGITWQDLHDKREELLAQYRTQRGGIHYVTAQ